MNLFLKQWGTFVDSRLLIRHFWSGLVLRTAISVWNSLNDLEKCVLCFINIIKLISWMFTAKKVVISLAQYIIFNNNNNKYEKKLTLLPSLCIYSDLKLIVHCFLALHCTIKQFGVMMYLSLTSGHTGIRTAFTRTSVWPRENSVRWN